MKKILVLMLFSISIEASCSNISSIFYNVENETIVVESKVIKEHVNYFECEIIRVFKGDLNKRRCIVLKADANYIYRVGDDNELKYSKNKTYILFIEKNDSSEFVLNTGYFLRKGLIFGVLPDGFGFDVELFRMFIQSIYTSPNISLHNSLIKKLTETTNPKVISSYLDFLYYSKYKGYDDSFEALLKTDNTSVLLSLSRILFIQKHELSSQLINKMIFNDSVILKSLFSNIKETKYEEAIPILINNYKGFDIETSAHFIDLAMYFKNDSLCDFIDEIIKYNKCNDTLLKEFLSQLLKNSDCDCDSVVKGYLLHNSVTENKLTTNYIQILFFRPHKNINSLIEILTQINNLENSQLNNNIISVLNSYYENYELLKSYDVEDYLVDLSFKTANIMISNFSIRLNSVNSTFFNNPSLFYNKFEDEKAIAGNYKSVQDSSIYIYLIENDSLPKKDTVIARIHIGENNLDKKTDIGISIFLKDYSSLNFILLYDPFERTFIKYLKVIDPENFKLFCSSYYDYVSKKYSVLDSKDLFLRNLMGNVTE